MLCNNSIRLGSYLPVSTTYMLVILLFCILIEIILINILI